MEPIRSVCSTTAILMSLLLWPLLATAELLPSADLVLVNKSQRKLYLMREGVIYREYRVALGKNPKGHKQREGDDRTPEGFYWLDWRNPDSQYYKAIHVSYPNEKDRTAAKNRKVKPGGMIMIHGMPNFPSKPAKNYQNRDWTEGCIAVSNEAMEEIWHAVEDDTPILIEP
ncbi:MAG: L,D-transpeptidase family protein [Pseudomonadales bacterium]|jgi:murein L,D-transpeptidase YafK|nr:L,D-transpeptidase family protein [Pseudomonadales bacterium]MCP5333372.1 L,D-transpeptidase family protein [Pseudomonadales bacterium]HMU90857.1 L,D-transpeptidase family protein [Pseudomonadales bacterium]HMW15828.1 L,D-transpeptidase family protein [Pseudomonadales bacterium]HMW82675.1 L,D-transpeptidase family protein [Pseudomonadales bacterium]